MRDAVGCPTRYSQAGEIREIMSCKAMSQGKPQYLKKMPSRGEIVFQTCAVRDDVRDALTDKFVLAEMPQAPSREMSKWKFGASIVMLEDLTLCQS